MPDIDVLDVKIENLGEKVEVLTRRMDNMEANNTRVNEAIIKTTSILERMEERNIQQDKVIDKLSGAIEKQTEMSYKVNENLTIINTDMKEVKTKVDKLEKKEEDSKIDTKTWWPKIFWFTIGIGGTIIAEIIKKSLKL